MIRIMLSKWPIVVRNELLLIPSDNAITMFPPLNIERRLVEEGTQDSGTLRRRKNKFVVPMYIGRESVKSRVRRRLRERMFLAAGSLRSSTEQRCARLDIGVDRRPVFRSA